MKTYDTKNFDEKMAYHNAHFRCQQAKSIVWNKVMKDNNIYNGWDNAYALRIAHMYLKKKKSISSKKETVKFFLEIIKFHIQRYRDKYAVIFEDKKIPNHMYDV